MYKSYFFITFRGINNIRRFFAVTAVGYRNSASQFFYAMNFLILRIKSGTYLKFLTVGEQGYTHFQTVAVDLVVIRASVLYAV